MRLTIAAWNLTLLFGACSARVLLFDAMCAPQDQPLICHASAAAVLLLITALLTSTNEQPTTRQLHGKIIKYDDDQHVHKLAA